MAAESRTFQASPCCFNGPLHLSLSLPLAFFFLHPPFLPSPFPLARMSGQSFLEVRSEEEEGDLFSFPGDPLLAPPAPCWS